MPDDWKIVFTRLDYFLAFGLGSGLAPVAPGTAGSALGLLLFIPALYAPFPVQVIIIVIGFVLGVWVSDRVAKHMQVKDPGGIVWDEFVGMWITLLWLPSEIWLLPAFLLFRLFDIWKPWPVRVADEKLAGGFGIMLDDVFAGFYALVAVQILNFGLQQFIS
ncbi:MAG: phosphatidylglycerophosphatase A [Gammaproteobacteria bacterium]|jgi:phosphatidylglycerophosphatase A|nr:phosphatidylglycerophosphatase A [Gammaproteobacteria bacterium]MBT3868199.1 phosphatidylglycerophosphatase A [Gammaproteobacteria bacterium]MBT4381822.1 phosphatidylglycerophosphatase A [Gammaproteobacteria bacterium]MBT4617696.1 phosphatidylglycerophosphatase A [Gammaproteobacteria bacterium]MBT5197330.1 phosphatidylglycerophosphatase A [Gammaproteobacteria bacterium]